MDDAVQTTINRAALRTHYEGCWRHEGHHACAVAKVEQLQIAAESGLEAEGLRRQLTKAVAQVAAITLAVEWLWGFWDGNTLVAKPGYEDDIREAWGRLLVARDAGVAAKLLERLATAELAAHVHDKSCGELAQTVHTERALRREAEQNIIEMKIALNKALDATKTPGAWPEGKIMTITERIFWLNSKLQFTEAELSNGHRALTKAGISSSDESGKLSICGRVVRLGAIAIQVEQATQICSEVEMAKQRAEALAALVTPELVALLEQMADYARGAAHAAKGSPDNVDAAYIAEETARELVAQIREALDER